MLFSLFASLALARSVVPQESVGTGACALCEMAVSYVDAFIAANPNATATTIEAKLDQICAYFGPDADECTTFVNNEVPAILSYLEMMPADQVCAALKVCDNSTAIAVEVRGAAEAAEETVRASESNQFAAKARCDVCQVAASSALSSAKAGASSAAALKRAVESCAAFSANPTAYGLCIRASKAVTAEYASLAANSCPHYTCVKAGECAAVGDGLCSLCTMAVSYAQEFIKANPNATTTEIEDSLEAICGYLGSEAAQCNQFVQEYTPTVVQYLESMPAAQVCGEISLCSSTTTDLPVEEARAMLNKQAAL